MVRWLTAVVMTGASVGVPAQSVPAQDASGVVLTKDIAYSTNANARGVIDLARPSAPGPHPALLVLHGGQFRTGERASLEPLLKTFAARGYVAASVTYRLAPGNQFPAAIQDVKGAVRFLRANAERFALDPDRLCTVGLDAGGTLALLAALAPAVPEFEIGGSARDQSSRVACAASFFAPTDLARLASVPELAESLSLFLGGNPAGAKKAYALASPLNWVTPDAPPILAIHGTADRLVPIEQSKLLVDRLTSVGAAAELASIEGAGHDTFTPDQMDAAERRLFSFLDRHIGRATPERIVIVADHGSRRQIVAIAWPSGRELWTQPNAGGHAVQPLANGNVLITMGPEKKVVEVNQAKEIVWTYGVEEGLEHPISAQRLPNGNTLIGDAQIGKVIEVDVSGKVVWQYADPDLANMRMRNSRRTAAGTTLIAIEAAGKIIELNPAGQIIWTYAGVGERRRPYKAHRLPNGHTIITMTSPGELVEVDASGKIVRTVGGAGSEVTLIWASGFDVFPNGNLLLSDYLGRRMMEIDSAGRVVHEVRMPTRTTASVAIVK